jgi:hypothetical protein
MLKLFFTKIQKFVSNSFKKIVFFAKKRRCAWTSEPKPVCAPSDYERQFLPVITLSEAGA